MTKNNILSNSTTASTPASVTQLPVITINGKQMLPAKQVAERVGFKNPASALQRLKRKFPDAVYTLRFAEADEEARRLWSGKTSFTNRSLLTIEGVAHLIQMSRSPQAKAFQEWLNETVVPTLATDGVYVNGEESLDPADKAALIDPEKDRLKSKVQELAKKGAKLQGRRHELLAENRGLKDSLKRQKKELKTQKECGDLLLDQLNKANDTVAELAKQVEYLRMEVKLLKGELPAPQQEDDDVVTTVDANGLVIKIVRK